MSDYIDKLSYVSKESAILIMKEEYGEDFIPEDCEQIGVQEFAQTLNDDCLPYTKENYSCGELKGSGDWLVGVL